MPPNDAAYYQQLRDALEEVNASIGGLRDQLQRDTNALVDRRLIEFDRRVTALERVVFGTPTEGVVGIIPQLSAIKGALDTMTKEGQQRTWLMRGAVIGLGLNLAQSTGLLPALLKLFVP